VLARLDVRNRQRHGDDGQLGSRPWSVSLAELVSCCGEGGYFAGVSQIDPFGSVVERTERAEIAADADLMQPGATLAALAADSGRPDRA